jgi:hypothetical protein
VFGVQAAPGVNGLHSEPIRDNDDDAMSSGSIRSVDIRSLEIVQIGRRRPALPSEAQQEPDTRTTVLDLFLKKGGEKK